MNKKIIKKGVLFALSLLIANPVHPMESLSGSKEKIKKNVLKAAVAVGAHTLLKKLGILNSNNQQIKDGSNLEGYLNLKIEIEELKSTVEKMKADNPYFAARSTITMIDYNFEQAEEAHKEANKLTFNIKRIKELLTAAEKQHNEEAIQAELWQSSSCNVGHALHTNHNTKKEDRTTVERIGDELIFLAVYDGHGGPEAAEYAQKNLHKKLISQLEISQLEQETNIKAALTNSFLETDEDLQGKYRNEKMNAGSTAVVALIDKDKTLHVAWAGDSRALVIRDGKVVFATKDHTPQAEKERIEKSGGKVMQTPKWDGSIEYRVNKILAVGRSLGDFSLGYAQDQQEEKVISALPDTQMFKLETGDVVLLFSDGLCQINKQSTEAEQNSFIAEFVEEQLKAGCTPQKIAQNLAHHCLYSDDTSVIVARIEQ